MAVDHSSNFGLDGGEGSGDKSSESDELIGSVITGLSVGLIWMGR